MVRHPAGISRLSYWQAVVLGSFMILARHVGFTVWGPTQSTPTSLFSFVAVSCYFSGFKCLLAWHLGNGFLPVSLAFPDPTVIKLAGLQPWYTPVNKRAGFENRPEVNLFSALTEFFHLPEPALLIKMGIAGICQRCLEEEGDKAGLSTDLAGPRQRSLSYY